MLLDSSEAKTELGILINHIVYIAKRGDELLLASAKLAVASLTNSPPQLEVVREINSSLSYRKKPPYEKMTPSTQVIVGLCFCFYIAISTLFIGVSGLKIPEQFFGVNASLVLLAAGSGAIGSIVSIMSRVGEFGSLASNDQMVYFFTGLFRPFIGTAFAVFVFCVVKAGVIPIELGAESREVLIISAIAFLSGFSERFAKDFAEKAESVIGVAKD